MLVAAADSALVQVLLNLGLVGISVVIAQMFFTFRAMVREHRQHAERVWLALGLFIPLFVNSLTEFGIWGETNYGIMFYLYLLYLLSIDAQPAKQPVASASPPPSTLAQA